ncbi:MAG: RNA ligase family protein [Armatimonas sp.]
MPQNTISEPITIPAELPACALFYREGSSDKVYQAGIEARSDGYVVNFAYGRRGSALSTGTKTSAPVDFAAATKIYDKIVAEKKGKGYTPDASGQAFAMSEKAGLVSGRLPQLLNPIEEDAVELYLTSSEWFLEEKHDGRRLMVEVKGGTVEGSNRKGLIVSLPREVETALQGLPDCVLDGELVGTKFWVFDILSWQGEAITHLSLSERVTIRQGIVSDNSAHAEVVSACATTEEKRAMHDSLKAAGREGVVFKRASAPYKVGRPSAGGDQVKFKFYATCSAVVAKVNAQRSVAVSLEGTLMGNVTIPINFDLPQAGDVVEVRYLYCLKGGSLYQPTYLGVRDDIASDECLLAQIKYKATPDEEDA